jgi:hypothetical protein
MNLLCHPHHQDRIQGDMGYPFFREQLSAIPWRTIYYSNICVQSIGKNRVSIETFDAWAAICKENN